MAFNNYSWSKPSTASVEVPLVADLDPQHLHPTASDELLGQQLWANSATAPVLPTEYVSDFPVGPIGGGGPIDYTPDLTNAAPPGPVGVPPTRSTFGVGKGPGLSDEQARAISGVVMNTDFGATAARQYQAPPDRDGEPHVALIEDANDFADSQSIQTLEYKRTGVGSPHDPYARTGKRTQRWWDRVLDMHWYDVRYRPAVVRNAYSAPGQPASGVQSQYTSPYPTTGGDNYRLLSTHDQFVSPQERRTPTPWDQPLTSDNTTVPSYLGLSAGL